MITYLDSQEISFTAVPSVSLGTTSQELIDNDAKQGNRFTIRESTTRRVYSNGKMENIFYGLTQRAGTVKGIGGYEECANLEIISIYEFNDLVLNKNYGQTKLYQNCEDKSSTSSSSDERRKYSSFQRNVRLNSYKSIETTSTTLIGVTTKINNNIVITTSKQAVNIKTHTITDYDTTSRSSSLSPGGVNYGNTIVELEPNEILWYLTNIPDGSSAEISNAFSRVFGPNKITISNLVNQIGSEIGLTYDELLIPKIFSDGEFRIPIFKDKTLSITTSENVSNVETFIAGVNSARITQKFPFNQQTAKFPLETFTVELIAKIITSKTEFIDFIGEGIYENEGELGSVYKTSTWLGPIVSTYKRNLTFENIGFEETYSKIGERKDAIRNFISYLGSSTKSTTNTQSTYSQTIKWFTSNNVAWSELYSKRVLRGKSSDAIEIQKRYFPAQYAFTTKFNILNFQPSIILNAGSLSLSKISYAQVVPNIFIPFPESFSTPNASISIGFSEILVTSISKQFFFPFVLKNSSVGHIYENLNETNTRNNYVYNTPIGYNKTNINIIGPGLYYTANPLKGEFSLSFYKEPSVFNSTKQLWLEPQDYIYIDKIYSNQYGNVFNRPSFISFSSKEFTDISFFLSYFN
jgi:hypothetical protein